MQTINITPTWEQILPALLAVIENGNFEGRKMAIEEITRMAQLADKVVKVSNCINSLTGPLPCEPNEEWQEYVLSIINE